MQSAAAIYNVCTAYLLSAYHKKHLEPVYTLGHCKHYIDLNRGPGPH